MAYHFRTTFGIGPNQIGATVLLPGPTVKIQLIDLYFYDITKGTIIINERPFSVTRYLLVVMQNLCHEQIGFTIWKDAICTDPYDLDVIRLALRRRARCEILHVRMLT